MNSGPACVVLATISWTFIIDLLLPSLYSIPAHRCIFAVGSILSAMGEVIMILAPLKSSANPHVVGISLTGLGILGHQTSSR